MMIRITAVARGEVQGVGYRYFVTGCARATGMTGYVKNQPDGSVLVVAEGEQTALDTFVRIITAEEDALIRVDFLAVTWGEASGEFAGFGVKW
jgi:acylphosphatase